LPQRKGTRQRNKAPIIKHSENPTPKQDSWWTTELISGTKGQHANLNCLILLREELTKQLPLKDRRKNPNKHYPTTWRDYDRASA
jgi:hypothetical protein